MSINPIHRAPYTNFHDLNLDWIIEVLNEFNTKLTNFVSLATIKYADPIQWNITSQYEANTVVVTATETHIFPCSRYRLGCLWTAQNSGRKSVILMNFGPM